MHKIELEIPERLETELRQVMETGAYSSEEEIAELALDIFLRRMSRLPHRKLTEAERHRLEQQHILEDIEWSMRPKEQDN